MAKILIVEDEGILACKTQLDLEDMGHEVIGIADTGVEALELIRKDVPDIILMDIVLQGTMNGVELTELINGRHPECKVIFVTAHMDDKTVELAMKTRHAGMIHKPLEPFKLIKALDESSGK